MHSSRLWGVSEIPIYAELYIISNITDIYVYILCIGMVVAEDSHEPIVDFGLYLWRCLKRSATC